MGRHPQLAKRPDTWPGWPHDVFESPYLDALESLVEAERSRDVGAGSLVHGDLDVTHIYFHDGRYSGLIDFGEMRGADLYFDLGHFLLHEGETRPAQLFDSLLAGYGEVAARRSSRGNTDLRDPAGAPPAIAVASPRRNRSPRSRLARLPVAELANFLEHKPAASSAAHDGRKVLDPG